MENTALKKAGRLLEIIHDLPERYGYGSLVEEAIEAFTGMDYQKAASIFEEAIDEYGPDKELWCCLAFAYIFDGEIDSGIECLSNYADLEDDDEKRELAESLIVDLESKMIMEESSREILAALERGEDVDVDEIMKEAGEEEEVKVNPDIFREYDIRGVADVDLKSPFVRLLGETLGIYFREKGESRVLVGRDNRLSGARIRDALVEGLTSVGCDVYDIGVVITPIFYYARISKGINAGVMITASHNPTEYNGFKVALGSATIHGEEIKEVGRRVEERAKELALGIGITAESTKPGKVFEVDAVEDYLSMITDKIKLGDRKLKVVVDCGNGTAGLFVERYLHSLGCEVIPLYCESDPTFPNHHPDPVKSSNLTDMIKVVKKSKADVGIGFDGDGDRIGVVDDKGEIIWGDKLMILYWREILKKHPGADVIIEVKCSQALVDEVEKLGGKPFFYKTGHSLIKAKMKEMGAVFTGEMSGHMFFADEYFGFDDAFYAAGRLLRILSNSDRSLSELLADVPRYYSTAETRIPCSDKDKFRVVAELTERLRKRYEVIDVDGVRVIFPDGWGLARCSNTQPVIVARCEGRSPEALEEISRIMKEELESFKEVEPFEWEY